MTETETNANPQATQRVTPELMAEFQAFLEARANSAPAPAPPAAEQRENGKPPVTMPQFFSPPVDLTQPNDPAALPGLSLEARLNAAYGGFNGGSPVGDGADAILVHRIDGRMF